MREARDIKGINIVLKEIFDFIDYLRNHNFDLRGKKVVNAAPSENDNDYVIRKELYDLELRVRALEAKTNA